MSRPGRRSVIRRRGSNLISDRPSRPPAPPTSDEEELIPFSLADLGLSEDEIARINQSDEQEDLPETPTDEDALIPFSLTDLGLGEDETTAETTFDDEKTQPAGQIGAL